MATGERCDAIEPAIGGNIEPSFPTVDPAPVAVSPRDGAGCHGVAWLS